MNSYRQTYLDTDLRELVGLCHPESFERFEQLFAGRVGSLLNLSELARDCELSTDTVRRFMHYYRQLFVAWSALPHHANLGKRMMKMPQWYFTDTGLLRAVKMGGPPAAVLAHALIKEDVVPRIDLERAIERRKIFLKNPHRHSYQEELGNG